jgi:hypothetical protein
MGTRTQREETWGRIEYDRQWDEFEAYFNEDNSDSVIVDRPISAGCLVTGRCNLLCQYCYGNDEVLPSKEREIPADEWKQKLAEFYEIDGRRIGSLPRVEHVIRDCESEPRSRTHMCRTSQRSVGPSMIG